MILFAMAKGDILTIPFFIMLCLSPAITDTSQCLNTPKMDVLGRGFDLLTHSDKKQVVDFKYSQCLTTLDQSYLVADNVVVQSRRYTQSQLFSELIKDWGSYSSATISSKSKKINVFGGRADISGSFSYSFQSAKKKMVDYRSVVARSEVRNLVLSAYIDEAIPSIDPVLLSLLQKASNDLDAGRVERARYNLGTIVRDYGTHFTSHVDLGGLIVEDNYVLAAFVANNSNVQHQIAEIASEDFLKMLSFRNKDDSCHEKDLVKQYKNNRVFSVVETIGGIPLESNMSLSLWVQSVPENVVAVSREITPLLNLLSISNFPHVTNDNLIKLRDEFTLVTDRYIQYNTHLGCTDVSSQNFDYTANIDDGSCQLTPLNLSFGGLYQQCQMVEGLDFNICETQHLNGVNPFTNTYSCMPGYQAIIVLNTTAESNYCSPDDCTSSEDCSDSCFGLVTTWCAPNLTYPPETERYFGGLYSSLMTNPVTGRHSCPITYIAVPFGTDVKVCVGAQFDLGSEHSVPFGGFFSCNQGNPNTAYDTLAAHWAKACPPGYSEHVAWFEEDCVLKYCMKGSVFTVQTNFPLLSPPYVSSSVMFQDEDRKRSKKEGLPSGTVVAIAVGSVLGVIVLLLLVVAAWKRRRRHFPIGVESADEEEPIQSASKDRHYESFLDNSSSSQRD